MSLFNETTERNDGKWRCTWIHAFGYLPDLSFLCDFDFFLCRELRLFDSAVLSWLAPAAHVGYTPVCALRVLLRCRGDWSCDFSERWPFFLRPACLETWVLFLGERPPHAPSCRGCGRRIRSLWHVGRAGGSNPLQSANVLLHMLTGQSYSTETSPTGKICVVMHADNVVQVCGIILDGIRAKWATRYAWGRSPSLVSSGQ